MSRLSTGLDDPARVIDLDRRIYAVKNHNVKYAAKGASKSVTWIYACKFGCSAISFDGSEVPLLQRAVL